MKQTSIVATLVACAAILAGCGAASSASSASPSTTPQSIPAGSSSVASHACTATAQGELVSIANRIYQQAVSGRNEAAAVARIARSTALGPAVASGDPVAVQAALKPLIKHQITRIVVTSPSGRQLASVGTSASYAPVSGTILSGGLPVGNFVLSVSDDRAFASLLRGLTGVSASFGPARIPQASAAFGAVAFPQGHRTISLVMPHLPSTLCGADAADTRLNTIGYVGRKLSIDEKYGPAAVRSVRHAEKDPAFRAAVMSGNGSALWNAIVGFFRDNHFHIVRVRAWNGAHVIGDVGGPYVLDPAVGVIHGKGGKVAAHFMLSIQDDTGYIKLMHRFTGADVVLHTTGGAVRPGTVPGSDLEPGPAYAPGLTRVVYHGTKYRAYGLTGTAFPNNPLEISLVMR